MESTYDPTAWLRVRAVQACAFNVMAAGTFFTSSLLCELYKKDFKKHLIPGGFRGEGEVQLQNCCCGRWEGLSCLLSMALTACVMGNTILGD